MSAQNSQPGSNGAQPVVSKDLLDFGASSLESRFMVESATEPSTSMLLDEESDEEMPQAASKPSITRVDFASDLMSRVAAFLPQLQSANQQLEHDVQQHGLDALNIEAISDDDEQYIEMNLGLGVLEDKQQCQEGMGENWAIRLPGQPDDGEEGGGAPNILLIPEDSDAESEHEDSDEDESSMDEDSEEASEEDEDDDE